MDASQKRERARFMCNGCHGILFVSDIETGACPRCNRVTTQVATLAPIGAKPVLTPQRLTEERKYYVT